MSFRRRRVVSHSGLSRLSVLLAGALLIILLAGCDLPLLGQIMGTKSSTPAPPPKPVTLDLSSIATCTQPGTCESCLMEAQWSPDGARLAILKTCFLSRGTDPNGAVLLFDAHTYELLAQIALQKTIVEVGKLPSVCAEGNGVNIQQTVNIDAREVVWTADSHSIWVLELSAGRDAWILRPWWSRRVTPQRLWPARSASAAKRLLFGDVHGLGSADGRACGVRRSSSGSCLPLGR
jgi:hypothetical protein